MADPQTGPARDVDAPPHAGQSAAAGTPRGRGPRERALLALSVALLAGVVLAVVLAPTARAPAPRGASSTASSLSQVTPTLSASAQLAPGTGWTPRGPAWAQAVAFSPQAATIGYTCGAPNLISPDQPAPLMLGETRDGGATWKTVPLPAKGVICRLTVDPLDYGDVVVYADTCEVCGADDRGALYRPGIKQGTWQNITPQLADGAFVGVQAWAWVGQTLYLVPTVSGEAAPTQLLVSTNYGAFTPLPSSLVFGDASAGVRRIDALQASGPALYLTYDGTCSGQQCVQMRQKASGDAPWTSFAPTSNSAPVTLVPASISGAALYGQRQALRAPPGDSVSGYVASSDGGATWRALPPLPGGTFALTFADTPDGTLYAVAYSAGSGSDVVPDGVYRLDAGAASWRFVASSPIGPDFVVTYDNFGHPVALWAWAHHPVSGGVPVPGIATHAP